MAVGAVVLLGVLLTMPGGVPAKAAKDPDGLYVGDNASARVAKEGRVLKGLRVQLTVLCVDALGNTDVVPTEGYAPRAKISRSGRFSGVHENDGTENEFSGRLRGRSLTGEMTVSYESCSGTLDFEARQRAG